MSPVPLPPRSKLADLFGGLSFYAGSAAFSVFSASALSQISCATTLPQRALPDNVSEIMCNTPISAHLLVGVGFSFVAVSAKCMENWLDPRSNERRLCDCC